MDYEYIEMEPHTWDGDSLQCLLAELLHQHSDVTNDRLLDLYTAKVRENPYLIEMAVGRAFSQDVALIRELGPELTIGAASMPENLLRETHGRK